MEVQRYANIVPNGVQHVSHVDLTVNGETIPAGSLINPLFTNLLKVRLIKTYTDKKLSPFIECSCLIPG